MNSNFITRALCFHGQPMQKIWEDERGTGDLQKCGLPQEISYSVYSERQKYFTFQDRAKRLKLHQFLAKKATDLYDADLIPELYMEKNDEKQAEAKLYAAVMPPYEVFVNNSKDKIKRWRCILDGIKPGDLIYAVITKTGKAELTTTKVHSRTQRPFPTNSGVVTTTTTKVQPLCTAPPVVRCLNDIPIKATLQSINAASLPLDERGKPRPFTINDHICCEVIGISVDADRLLLGMDKVFPKNSNVHLGLVSPKDLPSYYRKISNQTTCYEDYLLSSKEVLNPNYDILFNMNGLDFKENFSLMSSLKNGFPKKDYATDIRQAQASKWAFRSVADGIDNFKIGRHVEAFQCLNKALVIDPRNVEGLVARGALYANKGSFLKAIDDFEKALKLNMYHVNARKYMGETLVALGHNYEEENRTEDAIKAYTDCLNLIPNHEQARLSLEAMHNRNGGQMLDSLLSIPGTSMPLRSENIQVNKESSDDEGSTDTDSDSSAECTIVSATNPQNNSVAVSPFMKRSSSDLCSTKQQYKQPFYMAAQSNVPPALLLRNDLNDFKLDDDDTETRVRKLLHEASKYTKEKKKKTKQKKSKKSKKEHRKDKTNEMSKGNLKLQASSSGMSGINAVNKFADNCQVAQQSCRKSDSPPPKAPSMRLPSDTLSAFNKATTSAYGNTSAADAKEQLEQQQPVKLSFQIRKAVKVDKFGLVRIATPIDNKFRSASRSRSRTRSRTRSPSRSRRHSTIRRDRGRSRSISYDRHRRRSRSYSRSRSRSSYRRRYRGRYFGRRRSPSPFMPRKSSPHRKRSRSHEPPYKHRSRERQVDRRSWTRYPEPKSKKQSPNPLSKRWEHDKYKDMSDDGPSIEEIDEIINKAQKERKQEIINRDKDILKKVKE